MYFLIVMLYTLIINVHANSDNDFIVDYFEYKKTPRVVGFSCNFIEDDLSLVKNLNKNNMAVALSKLNDKFKISTFAKTKYWKLGIFFDARCYNSDKASQKFLEVSSHSMFNDLHLWLILGNSLDQALQIIDDRAFGLQTDLVIALPSETSFKYEFYDVYNLSKQRGGKLTITFLGEWNEKQGINMKVKVPKFLRRSNLHGFKLRAIFFKSRYKPPNMTFENYLQDYTNNTKEGLTKFGYIMNKLLSELFNYNLEVVETPEWKIGDHVGPIVRALNNSEVDFTGSPLTMNSFRINWIKFTHQDWPFRTCFVFRNPQPRDMKIGEVFNPLSADTWYMTCMFLFLSTITMMLLLQFEYNDNLLTRFSDSLLLTIGSLCQQGTNIQMRFISTRIAFLFTMISSYLLYNYYSSSIVSVRLSEPIFKINDSLVELGKLQLKMATEWMIYFDFFIKKPEWEIKTFYTTWWLQIPENQQFMEPKKAMQLVKKGGFAYHMHPDVGYPFIDLTFENREICELMEVHLVRPTLSTFAVTMNSSFAEMAKIGLTKISEVGLRRRQLNKWSYKKPQCRKDVLSASSIDIFEFAPHLVLLIIGMIGAVVLYIFETMYKANVFKLRQNSAIFYRKITSGEKKLQSLCKP